MSLEKPTPSSSRTYRFAGPATNRAWQQVKGSRFCHSNRITEQCIFSQTRDVLVHVPILLHPERASYDVNLDKLLRSKMQLQDALTITAPEEVTADEVLNGIFGGQGGEPPHGTDRPLRVDDVPGLSWELFEALVAEIYSGDAREVILTLRSVDHGCDVVVLGHDRAGNRLVQCKHTTARVFEGDVAIREVASSRAHYEQRLGERFPHLAVHTPCRKVSRQSRAAAEVVIVVVPVRAGSGVIFTVRSPPTPPNEKPDAGTRSGSLDVPLTVSKPARVSTSFASKRRSPVLAPFAITRSLRLLIVGGREPLVKFTANAAGGRVTFAFAGVKVTPLFEGVTVRAPGGTR